MSVFFPVADTSVSIFFILGAGSLVGFLSGLLGVGGGFLMTPILMLFGIPPTVAAASDSCQIVAASSSGLAAHLRLGNVDLRMGGILLAGGLTGGALGVQLIKILLAFGEADAFIAVTYVILLGIVGGFMFITSLRSLRKEETQTAELSHPVKRPRALARLPWQVDFPRSNVRHSILVPFVVCTVVGLLAAVMGVGGGFLMVPVMVYLFGMPAHVAIGTSLFPILLTCADVTILQARTNHTVDILLAVFLAIASAVTAQIGARFSRRLKGQQLMIVLASLALLVAGKMLVDLTFEPPNLLAPVRTHGSAHVRTSARRPDVGQSDQTASSLRDVPPSTQKAPSSDSSDLDFSVVPERVPVGLFYSGSHIRVEGTAQPDSRVVVVIRGGERDEEFYKKVKAGPIWISGAKIDVSGVPALFYRFSSGALHDFLRPEVVEQYQLDEASIKTQMRIDPDDDRDLIVANWLELKAAEGTYALNRHALTWEPKTSEMAHFSADFPWPKGVPTGAYEITVYECREGTVVARGSRTFSEIRVGLVDRIASLASDHATWYGLACVAVAVILGFGIDLLTALIFGEKRRAAH